MANAVESVVVLLVATVVSARVVTAGVNRARARRAVPLPASSLLSSVVDSVVVVVPLPQPLRCGC